MHTSLSLQLSLFRSQKARIARQVQHGSDAFRAYEGRYRRRTARYQRTLSLADVHRQVARADVVYVGDYHTLRSAQDAFGGLVEAALQTGRRVVLALEFVEGRHQRALDDFLAGRLGERAFLTRIGHPYRNGFDIWPGFLPLFELARRRKLEVRAIDLRATGPTSLRRRDLYAARRIAEVARAADRPLVMALMGQYHVAPCHLPKEVARALGPQCARRSLVVYQNCESIWWALARRSREGQVDAVQLREGEVCLVHTSPLLCQQSFLDYLEAESDDAPLGDQAQARFRKMAELVGRFAGVDIRARLDEVVVLTPGSPRPLEQLAERGGLRPREVEALRRHILSGESCYVPRAKAAYLSSRSLNHAAEEAAHFVRHCAVGDGMDRSRGMAAAFYARCVEEALGFFGSRLVNPKRACPGLPDWAVTFRTRRGEDRQVAAFLLAHKAAEADGPDQTARLLPLRRDRLFHAVSHGLGYLLGDRLHRAFEQGTLPRKALRALFADPLDDPRAAYFALVARVG
jgi:hypothetical protein